MLISAVFLIGAVHCSAQASADNQSSIFAKPGESERESRPRTIRDSLAKMRIEKEKKEFDRMIERGEQAVKIAAALENSLATKGRLTEIDKEHLASVEKLARQIRRDLGGEDDKDSDAGVSPRGQGFSISETVKSLRSTTEDLYNELKKTTRFTISATAIQSSNAVLRLARFMRISN